MQIHSTGRRYCRLGLWWANQGSFLGNSEAVARYRPHLWVRGTIHPPPQETLAGL